jgi:hypothetical protein
MSASSRLSFVFTSLMLLVLSAAAVQAQAAKCRPCQIAQKSCFVSCLGLHDDHKLRSCVIGCDNAAALCSCDEPPTLSSEDYVARSGLQVESVLKTAACHSTTACGPEYGSCAAWSSYSDCGDPFCGVALGCGECDEWGRCEAGGPAMRQARERYRVCFNAQSQPCTEYQRAWITLSCGC